MYHLYNMLELELGSVHAEVIGDGDDRSLQTTKIIKCLRETDINKNWRGLRFGTYALFLEAFVYRIVAYRSISLLHSSSTTDNLIE